jgi:hypothetical protein
LIGFERSTIQKTATLFRRLKRKIKATVANFRPIMIAANTPDIEQTFRMLTACLKIAVTAFLTILTFVAGQIFMKFAEPAFKLREEIGAIAQDLEMYSNE